jgi:hypothetical protein
MAKEVLVGHLIPFRPEEETPKFINCFEREREREVNVQYPLACNFFCLAISSLAMEKNLSESCLLFSIPFLNWLQPLLSHFCTKEMQKFRLVLFYYSYPKLHFR